MWSQFHKLRPSAKSPALQEPFREKGFTMGQRVLICDDELHIVKPLALKFRKAGYEVVTAEHGEDAWTVIQQQTPDLLISDILMPELDGFGLVSRIRDHEPTTPQ